MVKIMKAIEGSRPEAALTRVAEELKIEDLAWQSGFYQKPPKKITASGLILGFWKMQQLGKNTLRNWAVQIGLHSRKILTKQSLNERLTAGAVKLTKQVLELALNRKKDQLSLQARRAELGDVLSQFNRILIQDSTIQSLPGNLKEDFPGNYSHGERPAVFRLQALFNFTEEKWEDFSVDTYSVNDQSQAEWPMPKLQHGDLLLRDLGYFTLPAIERLIENQYVITKWHVQTHLFHPSGEKINLLTFLQGKKEVDIPILLGSKKRLPLRLVARKLPKKQAAKRRKEALEDRHAKAKHSEEYLELLQYEIFLTNISSSMLTAQQVIKLYALRWYIEVLFKSWKSYFNFRRMFLKERMSYHRAIITIYLLLIQFVYLTNEIYQYLNKKLNDRCDKLFSPIKVIDLINDLLEPILLITHPEQLDPLIPQFERHACYEKRKKRKNMKEKYLYFNEL